MKKKGKFDSERKEIVGEILIRQTLNPKTVSPFFFPADSIARYGTKTLQRETAWRGSSLKTNPCFLSLNNSILQQSTLNPKP
jgi:hypothetical protein